MAGRMHFTKRITATTKNACSEWRGSAEVNWPTGQQHRIKRLALLDVVWLASQRTLVDLQVVTLNDDSIGRQQVTWTRITSTSLNSTAPLYRHRQGRKQKFIWREECFYPIPSVQFLPFLCPVFLKPRSGPSNAAKGLGGALLVIAWQTDRQTDRHDWNYIPRRFTGGQHLNS